ncbi:MAG: hypothetical protein J0L78_15270 [Planctomycetes bacterium]|nr:hypothetical protein [Planctomycetota bacterium]
MPDNTLSPSDSVVELCRALEAWMNASPEAARAARAVARFVLSLQPAEPAQNPAPIEVPPPLIPPPPAETEIKPVVSKLTEPAPAPINGPRISPQAVADYLNRSIGTGIAAPTDRAQAHAPVHAFDRSGALPEHHVLVEISTNARIKARATRFFFDRQRHVQSGGTIYDFKDRYNALLAEATERGCDVWIVREWSRTLDESWLAKVQSWYESLALAADLVHSLHDPDFEALELLAESQSGLLSALQECNYFDQDQMETFAWLRDYGRSNQVYFPRFLSEQERADPASFDDVRRRLNARLARIEAHKKSESARGKALAKLRHHAARIPDGHELAHHWSRVADSIEMYINEGGAINSNQLGTLLLPLLDLSPSLPADAPAPKLSLLEDAFNHAERLRPADAASETSREPSPEIARVRDALRGKRLVLIGGIKKPERARAIEAAFELTELVWLGIGEHKSLERLEPAVVHSSTHAVAVMIRFSSHAYDDIKHACAREGKIYLRLPAGYSPAAIARAFVEQASEALEAPTQGAA